jgi:hypothetical protein
MPGRAPATQFDMRAPYLREMDQTTDMRLGPAPHPGPDKPVPSPQVPHPPAPEPQPAPAPEPPVDEPLSRG